MDSYEITHGLIWQHYGDTIAVIEPSSPERMCHALNHTASLVFLAIAKKKSHNKLLSEFTHSFGIPLTFAKKEIDSFLKEMESLKLIQKRPLC